MSNHDEAVQKATELFTKLADDAGNRINAALENNERLGKTDLSKELARDHECDSSFAFQAISGYMTMRGDLESAKGPGGGIGYVGQARALSESAVAMINAATVIVDALPATTDPKKPVRLSVKDLAVRVAKSLEASELDTYATLSKWIKTRTDVSMVKGPGGGIEKKGALPVPPSLQEPTQPTA